LLYPTVISVDINQPYSPISQDAASRFLNMERLRFYQSDPTENLVPFLDIQIPSDKLDDFTSWCKLTSIVTLGGFYSLPAENIMITRDLP